MKEKYNYKVSAILCAYNEEATVREVMEALVNSPLIDEVIAVDDGSKDRTGSIINEFRHPDHVKAILLAENRGKGYAMATAATQSSGDILLFIDADLKNLSSKHISILLDTFFTQECEMVVGFPIRGESITFVESLDPFRHLSGQRVLSRENFIALLNSICTSGYGVETILNDYFREQRKPIRSIFLPNLTHLIKVEKTGLWKAFGEYLLEGKQIMATKLKRRQFTFDSFFYNGNRK